MPNIVMKFGGSNFRNKQNINKLINLLKFEKNETKKIIC